MKKSYFFSNSSIFLSFLLLFSFCTSDRAGHMSDQQYQQIQSRFDSMQNTFTSLVDKYQSGSDTFSDELQAMYGEMQNMHRQMKKNHRRMMKRNMMGKGMQDGGMGNKKMSEKGKRESMRGQMSDEWYQQMMGMHERMAKLHRSRGEEKMARMNGRLATHFGDLMEDVPDSESTNNETAEEPAALDGENLYKQHCSSCHGSEGEGMAGSFPPVVNTRWVTADKSIPIRIVLHGLSGQIEVDDKTYWGNMPAFGMRLNNAETAAILNYLRSLSDKDLPDITQNEVKEIRQKYSDRSQPWSAEELK